MLPSTRSRLATALTLCFTLVDCGNSDPTITPVIPDQSALCTPRITSTEVSGPTVWESLSTSALNFKIETSDRCEHTVRLTGWVFQLASTTPALKHWELLENGGARVFGEITDPAKAFSSLNRNDTFLNVTHDKNGHRPVNYSLAMNAIGHAGEMFAGAKLVSVNYDVMGLQGTRTLADLKNGYLLSANTHRIERFNK